MVGARACITGAYMPQTPTVLEEVSHDIPLDERLSYAMTEARNPRNVVQMATRIDHPVRAPLLAKYDRRGKFCEATLGVFAEMDDLLLSDYDDLHRRPSDGSERAIEPSVYLDDGTWLHPVPVMPIVELFSDAVDTTKILMEMRAGGIVVARRFPNPAIRPLPIWFYSMRKVSDIMTRIAKKYVDVISCHSPR